MKKVTKKLICILLLVVFLVLTGCGHKDPKPENGMIKSPCAKLNASVVYRVG